MSESNPTSILENVADDANASIDNNTKPSPVILHQYKFVLLSHKDTDVLTLSSAKQMLPLDFPPIDTADLCSLKTDTDMSDILDKTVRTAARVVIIVRLLGRGVPGFQRLLDYVKKHDQDLIVVSGVPGSFEPDLTAMCTVSQETINEVMKYFHADGCARNMSNMLRYLADHLFKFGFGYDPAEAQPDHGLYHPRFMGSDRVEATISYLQSCATSNKPTVAIIFYRCHFLSGNSAFVDALLDELEASGVNAIGLYTETLRSHEPRHTVNGQMVDKFPTALTHLLNKTTGEVLIDVLICSMAFAMGEVNPDGPTLGNWSTEALQYLNVPVLQAINSVGTYEEWKESARGLGPLDTAMNVVIPEFDGRITSTVVSFMAPVDDSNIRYYEPLADRVAQVARQATRLATLRHKPNREKRIAFILTNSSGKAERIGDAVGLDTPASVIQVFEAMKDEGYYFGDEDDTFPQDGDVTARGDTLIQNLVDKCSYDEIYLTEDQLANAAGHVSSEVYQSMFDRLPKKQKDHMVDQWGEAPGIAYVHDDAIALSGLEFGNIFMALQPPRGYGMDPDKIYHTPDLPPPHNYYALYCWLRDEWKADAIVHMGKHGTLEWLPGKGVGLSNECYPDTFLDDMPLIYPFIINDPGEGMQSKRRAHAVIIDHLTPPMTTADGYGELAQLMQLVDEYYQIEMLDPTKMPLIQKQIWKLIQEINLDEDLSFILNHDHDHNHHSDGNHDEHDHGEQEHTDEAVQDHSHDRSHSHHHSHSEDNEVSEDNSPEDKPSHNHDHHHHNDEKEGSDEVSGSHNEHSHDECKDEVVEDHSHDRSHSHHHSHSEGNEVSEDNSHSHHRSHSEDTLSHDHDHHHRSARREESDEVSGSHNKHSHGEQSIEDCSHDHSQSHHQSHSADDEVSEDDSHSHHHSHSEDKPSHDHDHHNHRDKRGEERNEVSGSHNKHSHGEQSNEIVEDCSHDHSQSHHHHNHSEDSDEEEDHSDSHDHNHSGDKDAKDGRFESVLAKMDGKDFAHLIEDMDGYLCELAGAQIRDGLHVLGGVPKGEKMVDMLQALTRLNNLDVPSLREAIATMFGLDAPELLLNQGARLSDIPPMLTHLADRPLATAGDVIETIDDLVKHLLALLDEQHFDAEAIPTTIANTFPGLDESAETSNIKATLEFVCRSLVPNLKDTTLEITNLLHALNGQFVPAGPSGSPTRGMAHLLPTGRNFYACDPQALPSMAAWEVGQGLATEIIKRYLADTGGHPEHVAISVWGTAAMRTHGDDIAQIFALLGVRPIWQKENHRVTGVELIPLSELGRPRIDVTIRISGFFRDAFPHLIVSLDDAVNLAINADEPLDQNFIRKHYLEDIANDQNEESARYRVFGCPPGAYGIGILDLIEAQNWKDESDFAKCYINWGGYAYSGSSPEGIEAKTEFTHRLSTVEVAIHNQDDREHDIFDSDDYFQFHGGMIATIKALSGKQPKGYFGDTQNPAAPKVRDIKEETLRVYRTRVVNPKWLDSIKQHGYKGASEMAATVDYLFGFDATADVVQDFMYEQVAQSYALDKSTQEFYEQSNPWALRGISERLLEAAQRGMWANPNPDTLKALKQTLLQSDATLEGRSELS